MKKLTALLLVLVMLIPMILGVSAENEKISSFGENFDSYPDGKMTNLKMNPAYAWGYGMVGGTSNIRNKALVLTGTVTYQNLEIPAKITAGDSYAKDQTWEITVTVPEGMDEKAEIILHRYDAKGTPMNDRGKAVTDGGLRIHQDTLYYSQLLDKDKPTQIRTEYRALCKLNPGTYTFKRILNMNDPENFTYGISVLDQSGKEISKLKNIDCPQYTAIKSITFNTNRANKEVIFDDYKIYASGIATDLTLYDVAGKKVDSEALHAADTAYRLSWFNGTEKAKTMIVMAGFYEGDKLVEKKAMQELTMQPGSEGVETGTVEVAEGQSVKIYLRDPAQERAQLIKTILTVAVPVVVLAAVVTIVILVKKKKKNAPAADQPAAE